MNKREEIIEKKQRYRNQLRRNIAKLKLPMGNYWKDIIPMDIAECKRELAEVESDIEILEVGPKPDEDERESGGRETRDDANIRR